MNDLERKKGRYGVTLRPKSRDVPVVKQQRKWPILRTDTAQLARFVPIASSADPKICDGRLTMADTDDAPEDWYVEARAAFVAMVEAWPNGYTTETREAWPAELILPLTEKQDDKA